MLAIKIKLVSTLGAALLLAGCTPAGPRALLEGKRWIEREKYGPAVEHLRTAASLMPTNAHAWNYLGIALHHMGNGAEAEKAYQRALALDHDLTEAHYNLGSLWLEQNKPNLAKLEFTAYTLRRPTSVDGLLKLGSAQLHSREAIVAEKSFSEALRLSPHNPEALNGLGLARIQRGRINEATQFFNSALKRTADYPPALLNLAIVAHQYSKDRRLALQKYREYLAVRPPPQNADAVKALCRQLEQELAAPATAATNSLFDIKQGATTSGNPRP